MSVKPRGPWQGFLPPKSIVMVRSRAVRTAESAEPAGTSEAACALCAGRVAGKGLQGDPDAALMFVAQGQSSYQGKAGELLDKMIEAIGLQTDQVLRLSVGGNCPDCSAWLGERVKAGKPRVLVALGDATAGELLGTPASIAAIHGEFRDYLGVKLVPSFDPEYLLENPAAKRDAWADLQKVARELGLKIPAKPRTK